MIVREIDWIMNTSLVCERQIEVPSLPFEFYWYISSFFLFLQDTIGTKKNSFVTRATAHEFSVAHYTGKVTYDVRNMADKNRDFLPPEMVCFFFYSNTNLKLNIGKIIEFSLNIFADGNFKIVHKWNGENIILESIIKNRQLNCCLQSSNANW